MNCLEWHHAVNYALQVKNFFPRSDKRSSPHSMFFKHSPDLSLLRVFGCLCFKTVPLDKRSNKFEPNAIALTFLGFAKDCNIGTAITWNHSTKKINLVHIDNLMFHENLCYSDYISRKPSRLSINLPTVIEKHSKYLYESDLSSDDSDNELSHEHDKTEQIDTSSETAAKRPTEKNKSLNSVPTTENSPSNLLIDSDLPNSTISDDEIHIPNMQNYEIENSVSNESENEMNSTEPNPPKTTKSGRIIRLPERYTPESFTALKSCFVVLEAFETNKHKVKQKSERQKKKLVEKIISSKLTNTPNIYTDLSNQPDRKLYEEATVSEFTSLHDKGALKLVDRSSVPTNTEIGSIIVLLKRKRNGSYKARACFNGSKQKYKIGSDFRSPTLRIETLSTVLAIAAQKKLSFKGADISSAFTYAQMPANMKLFSEIPKGHPCFGDKNDKVLKIEKNLYGTKDAPSIWWLHLIKVLTQKLNLVQSSYDECVLFNPLSSLIVTIYTAVKVFFDL